MARPKKGNADYFTHDNDMRNNDKIKAVRQKFGLPGYAIWNMFLERMCRAENFTLQINALNLELWSGDFEIDKDKLVEMLQYFLEITLLKTDKEFPLAETVGNSFNGDFNGNLYSENLIKRFAPLLKKRVNDTENYKKREFPPTKTIKKEVSTNRNTQSRVKEENIKKNNKRKFLDFVFLDDVEHQKLIEKFKTEGTVDRIEKLNNYIGSTGKKYKSHYHTILAWDKNGGNGKLTKDDNAIIEPYNKKGFECKTPSCV